MRSFYFMACEIAPEKVALEEAARCSVAALQGWRLSGLEIHLLICARGRQCYTRDHQVAVVPVSPCPQPLQTHRLLCTVIFTGVNVIP